MLQRGTINFCLLYIPDQNVSLFAGQPKSSNSKPQDYNSPVCECRFELVCLCSSTVYKHMHESPIPSLLSATLPPCPSSSNRAVVTVSLRLDAPHNQKAHTTETLLVPKHPPITIIQPTSRKYGSAICQTQDLETIYCKVCEVIGNRARQTHALQMRRIINYVRGTSEAMLG